MLHEKQDGIIESALILAIVFSHAFFVISSIVLLSPTFDEGGHVLAGLYYINTDRLDYYFHNPPLVKYLFGLVAELANPPITLPLLPNHYNSWYPSLVAFEQENRANYLAIVSSARYVSLFFSLVGCFLIHGWTKELFGKRAAIFALALWAFNPMIISTACLATMDMAETVLFLTTIYIFSRYAIKPSAARALLAGTYIGIAVGTKFSGILLYVIAAIFLVLQGVNQIRKGSGAKKILCRIAEHSLLGMGASLFIICAAYQFQGVPTKLADQVFYSKTLSGVRTQIDLKNWEHHLTSGNRFTGGGILSAIGEIPLPLPREMILGFDAQLAHENFGLFGYLEGHWRKGGWISYYLYALAVKMPTFFLIYAGLSVFLWFTPLRVRVTAAQELLLFIPTFIYFTSVSLATGINVHARYILPSLPFIFIWTSRNIEFFRRKFDGLLVAVGVNQYRIKELLGVALLGCIVAFPAVSIHPYQLSFFNSPSGGPENGWKHLIDSNIDWGQDLLFLKKYMDRHPEIDTLHLAYFGSTLPSIVLDPERFTVATPLVRKSDEDIINDKERPFPEKRIVPGWYAVSIDFFTGLVMFLYDNKNNLYNAEPCAYCYFQLFKPVDRVGYSILIFHLDQDDVDRIYQICESKLPMWVNKKECVAGTLDSDYYLLPRKMNRIRLF